MSKHAARGWVTPSSYSTLQPTLSKTNIPIFNSTAATISTIKAVKLSTQEIPASRCRARRRPVRYEDEDEDDREEEYGYNLEIAMLEFYSQSAIGEALLVRAVVDEQEVEGFSSCLSYGTSPDPSRSVLPARAVIKSIDRIKGPFNPSNIEYLEKDLTWEAFKSRLSPK
ncbi:PREDICTED: uncharacterized protein LOC105125458 isoform X2 [Populus euphratica]|uniref:Uncharacterized protein LOC105125458 isoform X2 n=1 Tax=Populus euphratica TaxID=75702 RepID=A0AAJ6U7I5_POPEU|nr:PREDICTED: uncharacterized protein LOC105125458 isoform X2 [Populus euphratica]